MDILRSCNNRKQFKEWTSNHQETDQIVHQSVYAFKDCFTPYQHHFSHRFYIRSIDIFLNTLMPNLTASSYERVKISDFFSNSLDTISSMWAHSFPKILTSIVIAETCIIILSCNFVILCLCIFFVAEFFSSLLAVIIFTLTIRNL